MTANLEVKIRPGNSNDAVFIRKLVQTNLGNISIHTQLMKELKNDGFLLALMNDTPVGYVHYKADGPLIHVYAIVVDLISRYKKVGTNLLQEMLRLNPGTLEVHTEYAAEAIAGQKIIGLDFYEKNGFVVTETRQAYNKGAPNIYLMLKVSGEK